MGIEAPGLMESNPHAGPPAMGHHEFDPKGKPPGPGEGKH
jgi:hypothetical protein